MGPDLNPVPAPGVLGVCNLEAGNKRKKNEQIIILLNAESTMGKVEER